MRGWILHCIGSRYNSSSDLTTYGALSCELAFLQSLAICFTLVDQSVGRITQRAVMQLGIYMSQMMQRI